MKPIPHILFNGGYIMNNQDLYTLNKFRIKIYLINIAVLFCYVIGTIQNNASRYICSILFIILAIIDVVYNFYTNGTINRIANIYPIDFKFFRGVHNCNYHIMHILNIQHIATAISYIVVILDTCNNMVVVILCFIPLLLFFYLEGLIYYHYFKYTLKNIQMINHIK